MENVQRMAGILNLLRQATRASGQPRAGGGAERLPQRNQRFDQLLNDITLLTHQLEQRYWGILPFSIDTTSLQRLATRIHLAVTRPASSGSIMTAMSRKCWRSASSAAACWILLQPEQAGPQAVHALIPDIQTNRTSEQLLRQVVGYRDILQRTVITPRIHQGMVTARDQFAIDTTVYNMYEINTIAGTYGNPGVALALQVSFSSRPEALIALDRKMHNQANRCAGNIHRSSSRPSG